MARSAFSEQRMTLVDVATLRQTTLVTTENGLDQPTSAAFANDGSRTAYLTNGAFGSATGVPHPSLMKIRWGDEVEPRSVRSGVARYIRA